MDSEQLKCFYWVDSLVTLCWIKNYRPWKQFVTNRVQKILKDSEKSEWRFCPGSLNPAELPYRGSCGKDLSSNTLWLEDPEFLKQSCELWPSKGTVEQEIDEIASQEEVKSPPNETHTLANASQSVGKLIDLERFGSKQMLLRTLAWVLRFIGNCGLSRSNGTPNLYGELSSIELENAELKLISLIQGETFAEEFQILSGKKVERPPLRVTQFNLFLDKQGIIRTKSRITNASLADTKKRLFFCRLSTFIRNY